MEDKKVIDKIKTWLEANVEEQLLSIELRKDSARLMDKIEEWEKEIESGT